jgi:hypothetical protein
MTMLPANCLPLAECTAAQAYRADEVEHAGVLAHAWEIAPSPATKYHRAYNLNQPVMWSALAKLDGFRKLETGWDGDGAPAIDPQIIVAARQLINKHADLIASPFYVFPTLEGGVQLEWSREGGRRELELELETPQQIHYLFTDEAQGISEEDFCPVIDDALIRGLITRVNGG